MNRWRKGLSVACLVGFSPLALMSLHARPKVSRSATASAQARSKASAKPKPKPKPKPKAKPKPFYLHQFHVKQLGLDCSTCHVPVKEGSVVLKRPGHAQCMICHQADFGAKLNPKLCMQCHTEFPPTGNDLYPFPQTKNRGPVVFEFSHALHVDPEGRLNGKTHFRADCTFCHQLDAKGNEAFPSHTQCAACHSRAGMKPLLSAKSTTADCLGCHLPEAIENPDYIKGRVISVEVVTGKYPTIHFNHRLHFEHRDQFHLQCTTCHSNILKSTNLETLQLPKMIVCAQCHDAPRFMPAKFRMGNCQTCHADHTENPLVKPAFHTAMFRYHHASMASAPGATCYVCHAPVKPSMTPSRQCESCHEVMEPRSHHAAQWKEDVHGKYAAIDRQACATCHVADFCINCHNLLPRSHVPLAEFMNGGHARLAMLNERACLTCHTFENTCSRCHTTSLQK